MELIKSLRERKMLDLHLNEMHGLQYESIIGMKMLKNVFIEQFGLNEDVFNVIVSYVGAAERQTKRFWSFKVGFFPLDNLQPYALFPFKGTEAQYEDCLVSKFQSNIASGKYSDLTEALLGVVNGVRIFHLYVVFDHIRGRDD